MTARRMFIGIVIAVVGCLLALLFGSGSIPPCLGLQLTPVQCANGTGIMPTVGAALPLVFVALGIGALVIVPPRRTRWHAFLSGTGMVLGITRYLVTRPTLLEGPDFDGTWLSLPRPVELDALVASGIAGALIGLVVASIWRRGAVLPADAA